MSESITVKLPLHATTAKSIMNLHLGLDVRTPIDEANQDELERIRMDRAIIYEYLVNDGRVKDGETVEFVQTQGRRQPDKPLPSVSSRTTAFLGAKARVAPIVPLTDSGIPMPVAIGAGQPAPEPVAPVVPIVDTESGALSIPISADKVVERINTNTLRFRGRPLESDAASGDFAPSLIAHWENALDSSFGHTLGHTDRETLPYREIGFDVESTYPGLLTTLYKNTRLGKELIRLAKEFYAVVKPIRESLPTDPVARKAMRGKNRVKLMTKLFEMRRQLKSQYSIQGFVGES